MAKQSKSVVLNEYLTGTIVGASVEDEWGTRTQTNTDINFFGNIEKMRSDIIVSDDKRYNRETLRILVRTDDVNGINISSMISYEGNTTKYVVEDIYESDYTSRSITSAFKAYVYIIAKSIN